jgi:hypothetical protein
MPARDLTAEDVADWLRPDQAVEILHGEYKDKFLAKRTLLGRLAAGMVQAVSSHSVIDRDGHIERAVFVTITSGEWKRIETNDNCWITGDLIYSRSTGAYSQTTTSHFGVVFEPQGVCAIIPGAAPVEPPDKTAPPSASESETKRPRVSDAHLQAWFEFYKKVHTPVEDTEDRALEFARQCFPGKSVSRDRVRTLRGNVKRGPKTKQT